MIKTIVTFYKDHERNIASVEHVFDNTNSYEDIDKTEILEAIKTLLPKSNILDINFITMNDDEKSHNNESKLTPGRYFNGLKPEFEFYYHDIPKSVQDGLPNKKKLVLRQNPLYEDKIRTNFEEVYINVSCCVEDKYLKGYMVSLVVGKSTRCVVTPLRFYNLDGSDVEAVKFAQKMARLLNCKVVKEKKRIIPVK